MFVVNIGYTIIIIACLLMLDLIFKFFTIFSFRSKKKDISYNFFEKLFFKNLKEKMPKSLFILTNILSVLIILIIIIGIVNCCLEDIIISTIFRALGIIYFIIYFISCIILINATKNNW